MFPKRGQVWTYRERGRTFSLIWAIAAVVMLAIGIYFAVIGTTWLLLALAIGVAACGVVVFVSNEREHRDGP